MIQLQEHKKRIKNPPWLKLRLPTGHNYAKGVPVLKWVTV